MAERRVCVAVDPSEPSQAALRWAAKTIVRRGDEVRGGGGGGSGG